MENGKDLATQSTDLSVNLNSTAMASLKSQRTGLREFVTSQLRKETDFGVIPGTPKASLFKPGAEKLANLFQLGSRIIHRDKEVDIKANFAMYSVVVEVFHIPTGKAVSQCDGICNSHEKKYKMRSKYEFNPKTKRKEKVGDEETPIGDILNTLSKMAQKRAYVGAVILATGASDFFTQDLEDDDSGVLTNASGAVPLTAQSAPKAPIAPESSGAAGEVLVPFGRNKGIAIRDMSADELSNDIAYWRKKEIEDKKPLGGKLSEYIAAAESYLGKK